MPVYNYFKNSGKVCAVTGKSNEMVVIGRASRSMSDWKFNSLVKCLFSPSTAFVVGDIVTTGGKKYFITAMYKSNEGDIEGKMVLTNCIVAIGRLSKTYNANGVQTGYTPTSITSSTPAVHETVTGKMQQFDMGLLPTTVAKFTLDDLGTALLDRITLGGIAYQVDSINPTEIPGLVVLQCSLDKRK